MIERYKKILKHPLFVGVVIALLSIFGGYTLYQKNQQSGQNIAAESIWNSNIEQINQVMNGNGDNIIADNINVQSASLRALTDLETGKSISLTAPGTYFFVDPIDFSVYFDNQNEIDARAIRRDYFYEMQRDISGNFFLIGYVNGENYSNLSSNDVKDVTFSLFNNKTNDHDKIIGIPLPAVKDVNGRQIDLTASKNQQYILDLAINGNINSDVELHY